MNTLNMDCARDDAYQDEHECPDCGGYMVEDGIDTLRGTIEFMRCEWCGREVE